jgi:hypothetical protein
LTPSRFFISLNFDSLKNRSWENVPIPETSVFPRGIKNWIFFEGAETLVQNWW